MASEGYELSRKKPRASMPTYQRRVQTIRKLVKDLGETNLGCLLDAKRVIAFIRAGWPNVHTRISKMAHLIGHFRDPSDFPAFVPAIVEYRAAMQTHLLEREAMINENKKSERDKRCWADWGDIMKVSYGGVLTDPYELATIRLYTAIPPRRTEYRTLLVVNSDTGIIPSDPDLNYIDIAEKRTEIVLRRYKTSHSKGAYHISPVPPSVLSLAKKRGEGVYLFPYMIRGQSQWSKFLGDIFERHVGKRVAINVLRKSFVCHLFDGPALSQNALDKYASQMGTSSNQLFRNYRKIPEEAPETKGAPVAG